MKKTILHLPIFLALLFIGLSGYFAPGQAQTLHALLVIDTNDEELRPGPTRSLDKLSRQLKAIAHHTGLNVHKIILKGHQFTKFRLTQAIQQLKVGQDDIVFFYFVGHGFRYKNQRDQYPMLMVGRNGFDRPQHAGMPLREVSQQLRNKRGRLTIVIGECCNTKIGVHAPVDRNFKPNYMSVFNPRPDNYRKLFKDARGSLLMTSSKPHRPSWMTPTGGYFLEGLLNTFNKIVSENNLTNVRWDTLVNRVQDNAQKYAQSRGNTQTPIKNCNVTFSWSDQQYYNMGQKAYRQKKYAEAAHWYQRAAEKNHVLAQNNLGYMYKIGQGVTKNYAKAAKWYRKAAEQGHLASQSNLGNMYFHGDGVTKNHVKAAKWYRKAAKQGNAGAQNNLGYMYYNGHGVTKNPSEALKWYQKAAKQGNAEGQYNLGNMYEKGVVVHQDLAKAKEWYRRACKQKQEQACSALERLQG